MCGGPRGSTGKLRRKTLQQFWQKAVLDQARPELTSMTAAVWMTTEMPWQAFLRYWVSRMSPSNTVTLMFVSRSVEHKSRLLRNFFVGCIHLDYQKLS